MGLEVAGLLIALEGIDGAGTSTQIAPLAEHLRARGHTVVTTAEPSGQAVGQFIRQALHGKPALSDASLALLFAADRLHHLDAVILPALTAGSIVLTDRYMMSSFAYQASALPLSWVRTLNAQARLADLNVFFRCSPDTAATRRAARGRAADHYETDALQRRIAGTYEELVKNDASGPVAVIDAEASMADVARQLREAVDTLLLQKGMA